MKREIKVKAAPTGKISAVFNMLKTKGGPRLSIKQINQIARQGWAKVAASLRSTRR